MLPDANDHLLQHLKNKIVCRSKLPHCLAFHFFIITEPPIRSSTIVMERRTLESSSKKITGSMFSGLLILASLTIGTCQASPVVNPNSSRAVAHLSRTTADSSKDRLSASSNPNLKKGKRRKKRKKPLEAILMDEEFSSGFVPLDIEEDENEERILSALDRLADEHYDDSRTPYLSRNEKQPTFRKPAVTVKGQERSATGPPLSKTPQPPRQQHPWRTDSQTSTTGVPQRADFSSTPSDQRPHPPTYPRAQRMYQPSTPFPQTVQPAPVQREPPTDPAIEIVSLFPPTTPWIRNFLSSRPKDSLLPIPREYLSDGFNLAHLPPVVEHIGMGTTKVPTTNALTFPLYKAALHLILQEHEETTQVPAAVQRAAECLYTLVHARFIISPRGLETVRRVLRDQPIFGRCPRTGCRGMPVLPYSERPDYDSACTTKLYCCHCGETFMNWNSKTNGAAWGPSFCHLLLMTYGKDLMQDLYQLQVPPSCMEDNLVAPSIFGFKVHAASVFARQPDVA